MARPEDMRVLIVEDEPDVQFFLQAILEDAGFQVLTAGDGEQALEMIRAHKPDFISLDLVLPKKSGHKLLKELRHDHELAKIPVLIVTAHARDDLGQPMMENIFGSTALLGPGLYLEKPVNPRRYVECVCKALGVDIPEATQPDVAVRDELRDMIRTADMDTLHRMMDALKEENKVDKR